jgi:hypothetical protein
MSAKSGSWSLRGAGLGCAAAMASLTQARAATACWQLVTPPQAVKLNYDPFAFQPSTATISFQLSNPTDAPCALQLAAESMAHQALERFVVGDSGVGVELRPNQAAGSLHRAGQTGLYTLFLPSKAQTTISLDVTVVTDAVAEAGEHRAALILQLRDGGGRPVGVEWPLDVVLAAPARAQMNIAGADGAFGSQPAMTKVDFGVMTSGATRRVFLQVRANTTSKLTLQSEHQSRLAHTEPYEAYIPYVVGLAGTAIDLTRGLYGQTLESPRTAAGASIPMDITLGEVSSAMAGVYEDTLTIEFSPL